MVPGLTNGDAYTFSVYAIAGAGIGEPGVSDSVTPQPAPGAPTGVTGTPGNGQVTVSFTPPASNGGSPITGYTVTAQPGNITAPGTSSPILVGGLTNGQAYTFTVTRHERGRHLGRRRRRRARSRRAPCPARRPASRPRPGTARRL